MSAPTHFVDHYVHKLDSKNRVSIPAEMRNDLGKEFYITLGDEKNSLSILTEEGWDDFMQRLKKLPSSLREKAKLHYTAFAKKTSLDPNGRIILSEKFRNRINTEAGGEVVVYGSDERIEIWNKEAFYAKVEDSDNVNWAEEFDKYDI